MKTINVDADPKNANWPKRTKDVLLSEIEFGDGKKKAKKVRTKSSAAFECMSDAKKKRRR
jgi:hypothetical protein